MPLNMNSDIIMKHSMLNPRVGWVERPYAKPINTCTADGFHYAPKKQGASFYPSYKKSNTPRGYGIIKRSHQTGVTLIELIISIIIISIALSGILVVMNLTVRHSADPIIYHQSLAIAESYLEEILLQDYADPDTSGETDRALFDDVDDYHGLNDNGVHNQLGAAVSTLANYTVTINVTPRTLADSISAKQITVTVSNSEFSLNLVGYKTSY